MKITTERHFNCLDSLQDEVMGILADWVTPQADLTKRLKDNIYQRATELEKNQLSYLLPTQLRKFDENQNELERLQSDLTGCFNIYIE